MKVWIAREPHAEDDGVHCLVMFLDEPTLLSFSEWATFDSWESQGQKCYLPYTWFPSVKPGEKRQAVIAFANPEE